MELLSDFETSVKTLLKNELPGNSNNYGEFEKYGSQKRIYFSRIGMYGLEDMHEYSVIPKFFKNFYIFLYFNFSFI